MNTQQTDRELLELAAKAAGINLWWDGDSPKELVHHWSGNPEDGGEERDYPWNPLSDDGDALRLAVKLALSIVREEEFVQGERIPTVEVIGEWRKDDSRLCVMQSLDAHPCIATRRAIVRAAAEIGKAMP